MNTKIKEHRREYILAIIVCIEVAVLAYFAYRYGVHHVDSDDATEMALAEQLSRKGGIMSSNWYYSTDLRVIHT